MQDILRRYGLEICGRSGRSLISMLDYLSQYIDCRRLEAPGCSMPENRRGPGAEENRRGGAGVALKSISSLIYPWRFRTSTSASRRIYSRPQHHPYPSLLCWYILPHRIFNELRFFFESRASHARELSASQG